MLPPMTAKREKARPGVAVHAATAAAIVALEGDDRVTVRVATGAASHGAASTTPATRALPARMTSLAGYTPTVGDRVLVAGEESDLYVIGVLRAALPPTLERPLTLPATLSDGATVALVDGELELRDPAGHMLVRYAAGTAEIAAPAGDLVLSAPSGRVVLRSGLDVTIEATRDVVHRAGRSIALSAQAAGDPDATPQILISPRSVSTATDRVVTTAREVVTAARDVKTIADLATTTTKAFAVATERYELSATRIVEKARDAYRDVSDLAQSRLGRVRTVVAGVYSQRARRTVIKSEDDTSIDGRKVLLG